MKLKYLTFSLTALLIGCANKIVWENPNASQQQLSADDFACLQASQQYRPPTPTPMPQGQMVSGYYVAPSWSQNLSAVLANQGTYTTNQAMYESCMKSKGYLPKK